MSLLEQNTPRNKQINKKVLNLNLDISNHKEFEEETIRDSAVYVNEAENHLFDFYNLIV